MISNLLTVVVIIIIYLKPESYVQVICIWLEYLMNRITYIK